MIIILYITDTGHDTDNNLRQNMNIIMCIGKTQVPHRIDKLLRRVYKEEAILILQAGFVRMS